MADEEDELFAPVFLSSPKKKQSEQPQPAVEDGIDAMPKLAADSGASRNDLEIPVVYPIPKWKQRQIAREKEMMGGMPAVEISDQAIDVLRTVLVPAQPKPAPPPAAPLVDPKAFEEFIQTLGLPPDKLDDMRRLPEHNKAMMMQQHQAAIASQPPKREKKSRKSTNDAPPRPSKFGMIKQNLRKWSYASSSPTSEVLSLHTSEEMTSPTADKNAQLWRPKPTPLEEEGVSGGEESKMRELLSKNTVLERQNSSLQTEVEALHRRVTELEVGHRKTEELTTHLTRMQSLEEEVRDARKVIEERDRMLRTLLARVETLEVGIRQASLDSRSSSDLMSPVAQNTTTTTTTDLGSLLERNNKSALSPTPQDSERHKQRVLKLFRERANSSRSEETISTQEKGEPPSTQQKSDPSLPKVLSGRSRQASTKLVERSESWRRQLSTEAS